MSKVILTLMTLLALTIVQQSRASSVRTPWGAPDPIPTRALRAIAFPLYQNMGLPNSTQWHFLKFTEKVRQTCEEKVRGSYQNQNFINELTASSLEDDVKLTCLWPYLVGELEAGGTQLARENSTKSGLLLTLAARLQNIDLLDGYQKNKMDSVSAYARLLSALRLIRQIWPTVKVVSNRWYSPGDAYWMSVVPSFSAWLSGLTPWSYLMDYASALGCSTHDQNSCGERKKEILTSIYRAGQAVIKDPRLNDVVFKFDQLKEAQSSRQLSYIRDYTPIIRATMGYKETNFIATQPVTLMSLINYLATDLNDYFLEVSKTVVPSNDPCAQLEQISSNVRVEPNFKWGAWLVPFRDFPCTAPFGSSPRALWTAEHLLKSNATNRFVAYQARALLGSQAISITNLNADGRNLGMVYRMTIDIKDVLNQFNPLIEHREFAIPKDLNLKDDENAQFLINHLNKILN